MKKLIPILFLALASSAQAEAITECEAVNASPIEKVTITWGDRLPNNGPFAFREWQQKIQVTLTGPRYYQAYSAVATKTMVNTRVGAEHSTEAHLSENDRLYFWELVQHEINLAPKKDIAELILNEGSPWQKNIQLICS